LAGLVQPKDASTRWRTLIRVLRNGHRTHSQALRKNSLSDFHSRVAKPCINNSIPKHSLAKRGWRPARRAPQLLRLRTRYELPFATCEQPFLHYSMPKLAANSVSRPAKFSISLNVCVFS
ncbi:Unknown protein, partial [Striga hermonthica]